MASSATPNFSRAIPSTITGLPLLIPSLHLHLMSVGKSAQPLKSHFVPVNPACWGREESRGVYVRSDALRDYFGAELRNVGLSHF
jgi:hypothetical protein